MKYLSSITPMQLFTDWWKTRWIRGLVLLLIPIGIIDTLYTIGMTQLYGYEIEFNPVTRELLAAGYWIPWSLLNILGFTFFCMMAGSYYLHTRSRADGPDTLALSFVIALRIAMVGYNVTYYYIPWVGGMVYPPLWAGAFTFLLSLYLMNKLLRRQYDISWAQTKYSLTSRYVNYKDQKLITSTGIKQRVTTSTKSWNKETKHEILEDLPRVIRPWWSRAWVKRAAYLSLSLLVFVFMGMVLELINQFTGLAAWNQAHGPYFILNEVTGPPVMASFLAILMFIGLSLFFIFKAFSTTEEMPI